MLVATVPMLLLGVYLIAGVAIIAAVDLTDNLVTLVALLTFSWMVESAEGRQFSDGERAAGRSRRVIERVRTKVGVAWGLFKVTSHPYPHARHQFTAFPTLAACRSAVEGRDWLN